MVTNISAIVPAYNEVEKIEQTIRAIRTIPGIEQIIVVDDGSTDGTGQVAKAAGSDVVVMPQNSGKGLALTKGIAKAKGEIILLLDADVGETAQEARMLVEVLLEQNADMVVARFPPLLKGGGFGFAVRLARLGTRFLAGLHMEAPLSGQRALTKKSLAHLEPLLPGFGVEVGLNVRAARRGLRVVEVPLNMNHRVTGGDFRGVCHRTRQFFHIFYALFRLARER